MNENLKAIYVQIEGRIETAQVLLTECIELIYNAGYNQAIEDAMRIMDNNTDRDNLRSLKK